MANIVCNECEELIEGSQDTTQYGGSTVHRNCVDSRCQDCGLWSDECECPKYTYCTCCRYSPCRCDDFNSRIDARRGK